MSQERSLMRLWRSRRRREADAMLKYWQLLGQQAVRDMRHTEKVFASVSARRHTSERDNP